jgi:tetratricopeptide (TPR) repeat protein
MSVDINLPEERANLFSDLRQFSRICQVQNSETVLAFEWMFKLWNKVGEPLFELGYWNDFDRCGKIVLNSAKTVNDVVAQAQVLNELGWICMEWEDFETAHKYFDESLQKYQLLKDDRGECKMWRYFGVLSHRRGSFRLALEYYHKALNIVTVKHTEISSDDNWAFQEAELHNIFGETYLELNDFSKSYRELHLSIDKYYTLAEQHLKYRYYLTDPLLNLGRWHFLEGNYEKAKQHYQDCLHLSQDISRPDTEATALLRLAEVAEVESKEEEALKLASEAERVAGTEIRSVRDRAARFKERLLSNKNSF